MKNLVYVTEDDKNIRELICISLDGYNYDAVGFENAEDCLNEMVNKVPDLCIFDIMLPGIDGIAALKKIRVDKLWAKVPVILLTAKDSEVEKITGLDNGADDYVTKPFSVLELMARVRSILRRSDKIERAYDFGSISINTDTREVKTKDGILPFTFKEYEVLKYLAENKHRVVSRDELLNKIWGYEYTGETRTVDIHIRTVRLKLGEVGEVIKTVRGMGYRFNDE